MKGLISIACVAIIAAMIIFGIKPGMSVFADTTESTAESDNTTPSILDQIANFENIYTDALTEPFIKAEGKITDPDIAEYYHGLMEKTGLTNGGK